MIKKSMFCDLCKKAISDDMWCRLKVIGVDIESSTSVWHKLIESDPEKSSIHICHLCVSSIQDMKMVCGDGYRGCDGGVNCDVEHK